MIEMIDTYFEQRVQRQSNADDDLLKAVDHAP